MTHSVIMMSSVSGRKRPAPSEDLNQFIDFGRMLLTAAGTFRGRAFMFLFWGSDEDRAQVAQIGSDESGQVKPTIVARELVERLKPDSFVLVWEAWYLTMHLKPGEKPPERSKDIDLANHPDRKEALLVFYRSRTKKRFLRQMFHHGPDDTVAFDELLEDDADALKGLIGDAKIPEVPAYQ